MISSLVLAIFLVSKTGEMFLRSELRAPQLTPGLFYMLLCTLMQNVIWHHLTESPRETNGVTMAACVDGSSLALPSQMLRTKCYPGRKQLCSSLSSLTQTF